jgi:hypothetical protein
MAHFWLRGWTSKFTICKGPCRTQKCSPVLKIWYRPSVFPPELVTVFYPAVTPRFPSFTVRFPYRPVGLTFTVFYRTLPWFTVFYRVDDNSLCNWSGGWTEVFAPNNRPTTNLSFHLWSFERSIQQADDYTKKKEKKISSFEPSTWTDGRGGWQNYSTVKHRKVGNLVCFTVLYRPAKWPLPYRTVRTVKYGKTDFP